MATADSRPNPRMQMQSLKIVAGILRFGDVRFTTTTYYQKNHRSFVEKYLSDIRGAEPDITLGDQTTDKLFDENDMIQDFTPMKLLNVRAPNTDQEIVIMIQNLRALSQGPFHPRGFFRGMIYHDETLTDFVHSDDPIGCNEVIDGLIVVQGLNQNEFNNTSWLPATALTTTMEIIAKEDVWYRNATWGVSKEHDIYQLSSISVEMQKVFYQLLPNMIATPYKTRPIIFSWSRVFCEGHFPDIHIYTVLMGLVWLTKQLNERFRLRYNLPIISRLEMEHVRRMLELYQTWGRSAGRRIFGDRYLKSNVVDMFPDLDHLDDPANPNLEENQEVFHYFNSDLPGKIAHLTACVTIHAVSEAAVSPGFLDAKDLLKEFPVTDVATFAGCYKYVFSDSKCNLAPSNDDICVRATAYIPKETLSESIGKMHELLMPKTIRFSNSELICTYSLCGRQYIHPESESIEPPDDWVDADYLTGTDIEEIMEDEMENLDVADVD